MQTNTQSAEECSELLPLSSSLSTAVMLLTPADQKPKPTFKSNPHTSPSSVSDQKKRKSKSKWLKLKSTVQAAHAITQPHNHRRQQKGGSGGQPLSREDSFLKRFSTRHAAGSGGTYTPSVSQEARRESCTDDTDNETECLNDLQNESGLFVVNPDENFMFYWLTVTTVSVLYNLWTSIAREAFPEIGAGYVEVWMAADAVVDLVYVIDIIVQFRTGYLERGLIVYKTSKLAKHYVYSRAFLLDLFSLLPLDLAQLYLGIHPLLRFPRFLKSYRLYRFIYMVETRTAYPNMWRVANLSHVLFLGSHWFAAFYFLISKAENFESRWGYPLPVGNFSSVAQKYLRSLYWSTLTLTTIGDLSPPETNWEHVFTIVSYLIGVFVFATIVGQVGNVITNRNASRQEFERLLDGAKAYMRYHNVPQEMQRHVQRWYDYAWSRGRMNGGGDINALGLLPDKLKTELALHVNLETLKKVTIFQECEPEFLHDLVLKMRTYIFTPGDLICRKGEVAREMFIIADGLLEVISESGEILTRMSTGDFFGEIGILNLDGGVNRRTADVKSVGYSELIVLSRDDVLSALRDHPEAEILIKDYGRRRLRELGAHKRKQRQPVHQTSIVDEISVGLQKTNIQTSIANNVNGKSGVCLPTSAGNNMSVMQLVDVPPSWQQLLEKTGRMQGRKLEGEFSSYYSDESEPSNKHVDEPVQSAFYTNFNEKEPRRGSKNCREIPDDEKPQNTKSYNFHVGDVESGDDNTLVGRSLVKTETRDTLLSPDVECSRASQNSSGLFPERNNCLTTVIDETETSNKCPHDQKSNQNLRFQNPDWQQPNAGEINLSFLNAHDYMVNNPPDRCPPFRADDTTTRTFLRSASTQSRTRSKQLHYGGHSSSTAAGSAIHKSSSANCLKVENKMANVEEGSTPCNQLDINSIDSTYHNNRLPVPSQRGTDPTSVFHRVHSDPTAYLHIPVESPDPSDPSRKFSDPVDCTGMNDLLHNVSSLLRSAMMSRCTTYVERIRQLEAESRAKSTEISKLKSLLNQLNRDEEEL